MATSLRGWIANPSPEGFLISKATYLISDLLPAFTAALGVAAPEESARIKSNHWDIYLLLQEDPAELDGYDGSRFREILWELLDTVHDALDRAAPDGYYFGTVDGGSMSEYGYWKEG